MKDKELNEIRQLIDMMQSNLVELFTQLKDLRERLQIATGLSSESSPSILPLFSEVKSKDEISENSQSTDVGDSLQDESPVELNETDVSTNPSSEPDLQDIEETPSSEEQETESIDSSTTSARVSRVLDPIAHELRTGEATADIILEYLQAAKDYLIDEDARKKKVGRDMDIVLNFLKARGKRGIRTEERDNILKRIRRWKAHLVSYSDSPAM